MTGRHLSRRTAAAALFVAVVFAVSAGTVPAQATPLDDLRQKQTSLQQQGKQLDAQIQKLKNDAAKQQQYKDALDAKSLNLEQQIDSKDMQIRRLDADIQQKEQSIAAKQKAIKTNFEKLKGRVCALYKTGEASKIEIILSAKNVMDLADKTEILRVVSEHDTGLINTLKSDLNSVKAQKAAIVQNRKTVSAAKTSLVQNRQQLVALSGEAEKAIANLSRNRQDAESAQAGNQKAQRETDAFVNRWLSSYYISRSGSGSGAVGGQLATMMAEARKYIGTPYVMGGYSPSSAFDCSGYVSWVLNHSGWNVGRMTAAGLRSYCGTVSASAARPGDLVFFAGTYKSGISHVGIYVGNNTMLDAGGVGDPVNYSHFDTSSGHFHSFGRLP